MGLVLGRSGNNKTGLLVHTGVIDTGYTGNLGIIVTNLSWFPRLIRRGSRIAQIIFLPVHNEENMKAVHLHELEWMVTGDRKDKGYGSTGLF